VLGLGVCPRPETQDLPPGLLPDTDLGNLAGGPGAGHTRVTYHRTWETGLKVAIRVTTFSPDFFVFGLFVSFLTFSSILVS
jgi:hypothetical protein